jgi:hypothetical protein
MKGLIAAIVLAFTAATIVPAFAEVPGGTIQLAEKKPRKESRSHKGGHKEGNKEHRGGKKGHKGGKKGKREA